jgi:hypothetical protein
MHRWGDRICDLGCRGRVQRRLEERGYHRPVHHDGVIGGERTNVHDRACDHHAANGPADIGAIRAEATGLSNSGRGHLRVHD